MARLVFPDNTVLINFALLGRLDLLGELLNGRGGWCLTVHAECDRSSREHGLSDLSTVQSMLGEPLLPTGTERLETQRLRTLMARPGDRSTAHLGEAETFAIITTRSIDALFVTDDHPAAQFAASIPIRTATTGDLLRLAVRTGRLGVDAAWTSVTMLRSIPRVLSTPPYHFEPFRKWCES